MYCTYINWFSDLIGQFHERLVVLSDEVRACAKRPGDPLNQSVRILIEATHKYIQGNELMRNNAEHAKFTPDPLM